MRENKGSIRVVVVSSREAREVQGTGRSKGFYVWFRMLELVLYILLIFKERWSLVREQKGVPGFNFSLFSYQTLNPG